MPLSERVLKWRNLYGWTQAVLAAEVGVSPAAVAQWEIGDTSPTHEHLDALCTSLGITLSQFWGAIPAVRAA